MTVVSDTMRVALVPSARDALMNKILQKCDVLRGRCNLLRDGEKTGFVHRCSRKLMFDPAHEWELLTEEESNILAVLVKEGYVVCTYYAPYQHSYNPLF